MMYEVLKMTRGTRDMLIGTRPPRAMAAKNIKKSVIIVYYTLFTYSLLSFNYSSIEIKVIPVRSVRARSTSSGGQFKF
jgi:hypothetical protein